MRNPWILLVALAAALLLLGAPRRAWGEDEKSASLRIFRAELSLEEAEARPRGQFHLVLEVVCSEGDACEYDYQVEELAPRHRTLRVGELEVGEDGEIGAEVRWPVERVHCGTTWEGRVLVTATPDDPEDGPVLLAERPLSQVVPEDCGAASHH